jgi:hypothetical protein
MFSNILTFFRLPNKVVVRQYPFLPQAITLDRFAKKMEVGLFLRKNLGTFIGSFFHMFSLIN